jgi:SAM-dependent methyltransferase
MRGVPGAVGSVVSTVRPMAQLNRMAPFNCNICGTHNELGCFPTEPASCPCGSNVRSRALIHLLSMELFGRSLMLPDFPRLKSIRALGMTDKLCYAAVLEEKFDYTNTYYDREPRMDFTASHPESYGTYDFVLSADVLEHVAPPVERVIEEVHRLLKPNGFFAATVPCSADRHMREHFPGLNQYRVVPLGNSAVLINRRRDGQLEISDDLVFHGGIGSTLEMRQFGVPPLQSCLLESGFREVHFLVENLPGIGIVFDHDVSQPLIARKQPFVLEMCARSQIIDLWRAAEDRAAWESNRAQLAETQAQQYEAQATDLTTKIGLASQSRWLRLGRKLGFGPDFR